jgi:TonB family protein
LFDLERKRDRSEPASHSVLGLQEPEEPGGEAPITRSFLGLAGAALEPISSAPRPPVEKRSGPAAPEFNSGRRPDVPVVEPPRELFDLERKSDQGFPVERGILISLAGHIIFFLLLLYWPFGASSGKSLFPTFTPHVSKIDEPFPIVFRSAPGPERESRNAREFSGRNRRAGGGDPARPRSDTPFVPLRPGREGLAPGSGAIASSQPPPSARDRGDSRQGQVAPPPERSAQAQQPQGENVFRQPAGSPSAPSESGKLTNLDQAIKEAAKGVGVPGQGGAGFPNPEGGFVDSGPLSFETSWYDWGPYADEMVRRIKLHWDVPKLAELGWKGKLTIHFAIRLDGSVEGATIVSGSGIPPFDFAAMQAIVKSNPFRPLPKDLIAEVPGKTKEGITVTFFYNMRPGKDAGQGGDH